MINAPYHEKQMTWRWGAWRKQGYNNSKIVNAMARGDCV